MHDQEDEIKVEWKVINKKLSMYFIVNLEVVSWKKTVRKYRCESNIRKWRAKTRMTQEELADAAGVSISTITQLENNKITPSLLSVKDITDVFGIGIEELFTFIPIDKAIN